MAARRPFLCLSSAALLGWLATAGVAQTAPSRRPAPPTHAPLPALPPLLAYRHIDAANRAAVAAAPATPELPPRPAGAGRYVCAVLVCADADLDVAPWLGLRRQDVLVLAAPGPWLSAEAAALLEASVVEHRIPLLLLGHAACRSLRPPPPGTPPDALARRLATVQELAARRRQELLPTLLRWQREQLLAASEPLRARVAADQLRILPAAIDVASGALQWLLQPADLLPLAPVR